MTPGSRLEAFVAIGGRMVANQTLGGAHLLEAIEREIAADPDPLSAASRACRQRRFDEIIVSTLAPGLSRWVARDRVHQLERAVEVPVTHIYGPPRPRG